MLSQIIIKPLILPILLMLVYPTSSLAVTIQRISVSSNGIEGNHHSNHAAISSNGEFVAFESLANNLVELDSNGVQDIFIHNLTTSQTEIVSVASDGTQANAASAAAANNADGRYVVFSSYASNLSNDDNNGVQDIFIRDRQLGVTEIISTNAMRESGNGASDQPSISGNGQLVVFESQANNLLAIDTDLGWDIYLYDRTGHVLELISINADGLSGNGESRNPTISQDGRFVAFESSASNLVANDTNGQKDIFVYDRYTRSLERISLSSQGISANGPSNSPTISADGQYVAFESTASNFVENDFNEKSDIFLHNRFDNSTIRISDAADGGDAENSSNSPSINSDGRFVAFHAYANNLVLIDLNGQEDIFIFDQATGNKEVVSRNLEDGLFGNYGSFFPSVSGDGRHVAFMSSAFNLVPNDSNDRNDIFVVDRGPFNQPPAAHAGLDQNIYLTQSVLLDASASSDPDGDALAFKWRVDSTPIGSQAAIPTPNTENTIFTPDVVGDYIIELIVSDGFENSEPDYITITVSENSPPNAVALFSLLEGEAPLTISFDGTESTDPENDLLRYHWDFGDVYIQDDQSETAIASYLYTVAGEYVVTFTVTDEFGNIDVAQLGITVTAPNEAPQISIPPPQINNDTPLLVQFNATASDPNGDSLEYYWDFGDGNSSQEANPIHVYAEPGSYTVTLTVSDGLLQSSSEYTVVIESPLDINIEKAKLMAWKLKKHSGKIKLKGRFTYAGSIADINRFQVHVDNVLIANVAMNQFKQRTSTVFTHKSKGLYIKLDFNKPQFWIHRHNIDLHAIDVSNGVDILLSFDAVKAIDNISMHGINFKHWKNLRYINDKNWHNHKKLKLWKLHK